MKVEQTLQKYYESHLFFGEDGGLNKSKVKVYLGKFDLYVPNFEFRKSLVPYHDLHHIISGYNNSRIGEGEVSAWELGAGTIKKPIGLFYALAGFTTGILVNPARTYKAFCKGRTCEVLYKYSHNELLASEFDEVQTFSLNTNKVNNSVIDSSLFSIYIVVSSFFAIGYFALYGFSKIFKSA